MLLAWKAQGIMTLAGYILGFPADTPESIRRDIQIIQHELPLDVIEFFVLTPLPGSEDHQTLWRKGVEMEKDLNVYDVEHVCTAHEKMSREEWESVYREAWSLYYSPEHVKTLLRRAVATGVPLASLVKVLISFATTVPLENVHPLLFWPRFAWETFSKHMKLAGVIAKMSYAAFKIARNPASKTYMDQALTPVEDNEEERLELFTKTSGGTAAVTHVRKIAKLTHAAPAAE
jgi:hypothetical protein